MIVSLLLKATVILCAGLASSHAARTCRASVRHAMLLATFGAIAALPMAMARMPAVAIAVPADSSMAKVSAAIARPRGLAFMQSPGSRVATSHESQGFSPGNPPTPAANLPLDFTGMMSILWLGGAIVALLPLAIGIWRVRRLRRTALPSLALRAATARLTSDSGRLQRIDVLVHEQLDAPIACGVAHPAIILPVDAPAWDDAGLERALVHELEHIRRRDWLTQLFARAMCAALWFHPFVWIAYRQLCLCAEHACDDAVLRKEDGVSYADQLVTLARRTSARPRVAALGMAQRSSLSARVNAVLDSSRARGRTGRVRAALVAGGAAALLLAVAPLQLIAAVTPPVADDGQRPRAVQWLDRALIEAVEGGDLRDVREILDQGGNVNAAVDGDGSPLIVAAREGHLDLVALLLDRGADPNLAVEGDGAPLIMAAREGHQAIVQLLLDRGANIELMVPDDENALIQASAAGKLAVVKLLVTRGADVNARATVERRFDAVRWDGRAQRRVDNVTRREIRTPLGMALRGGHDDVAAFLKAQGAIE